MTRAPRRFATSGSCAEPRSCCVHWASSADPFPGPPTSDPLVDVCTTVPVSPQLRIGHGQIPSIELFAASLASPEKPIGSRVYQSINRLAPTTVTRSEVANFRVAARAPPHVFRVAAFGPQRRSCSWRARADGRSHLRVRRDCCCEKNSPRRPRRDRPAGFTAVRRSSIPSRTSRARLRRGIRRRHRRGRRSGT